MNYNVELLEDLNKLKKGDKFVLVHIFNVNSIVKTVCVSPKGEVNIIPMLTLKFQV